VNVTVKVVEFQATKSRETGLSAFFRSTASQLGQAIDGAGEITTADLTFPPSTSAGLTVFLDRIFHSDGAIEMVLQALVDENKAYILSRPRVMVVVGGSHSVIATNSKIPYSNTVVVGSTVRQVTAFRDTGVTMDVQVPKVIDDDNDWYSNQDTYIQLVLSASVTKEGQRRTIALDDQLAGSSNADNLIQVPEMVTRRINTTVWVQNGQVLSIGGLYSNTGSKSQTSLPWLTQTEDVVLGVADRVLPVSSVGSPISSTLGSNSRQEDKRELIFLIKAEVWYPDPALSLAEEFATSDEEQKKRKPTELITDVIKEITDLPKGVADELSGDTRGKGIESDLKELK